MTGLFNLRKADRIVGTTNMREAIMKGNPTHNPPICKPLLNARGIRGENIMRLIVSTTDMATNRVAIWLERTAEDRNESSAIRYPIPRS